MVRRMPSATLLCSAGCGVLQVNMQLPDPCCAAYLCCCVLLRCFWAILQLVTLCFAFYYCTWRATLVCLPASRHQVSAYTPPYVAATHELCELGFCVHAATFDSAHHTLACQSACLAATAACRCGLHTQAIQRRAAGSPSCYSLLLPLERRRQPRDVKVC